VITAGTVGVAVHRLVGNVQPLPAG
jgi:hypothetical protein